MTSRLRFTQLKLDKYCTRDINKRQCAVHLGISRMNLLKCNNFKSKKFRCLVTGTSVFSNVFESSYIQII